MPVANLPLVAARALHFWAVATLLGGAALTLSLRHASRYAESLLRTAAVVAGLSGLVWFAFVFAIVMGGADSFFDLEAWQTFVGAPFGLPWVVRILLCIVAIGAAIRPNPWPCLSLGFGFAMNQVWLGHVAAAAGSTFLLQFVLYGLHVAAGFLWSGALVMLCAISAEARRVPLAGLALFSTIGIAVVATIVLTGIANAVLRGVDLTELTTTAYGQLILVKIGLLIAMVALALVNRRKGRAHVDRISASLWLETVLGLAVLAAAAALGITPPPGNANL